MKTRISLLTLLLLLGLLVACGGAPEEAAPEPAEESTAAETEEAAAEVTISPLTPSSPEFPGATLTLNGIEDGQSLDSGTVAFDFDVENYELGVQTEDAGANGLANSADGQHIHLILNNGPYSAHYTADFEKELEDGHYVMLAFLSRSYHESVKEPTAAVVRQFTVGDAGEYEEADLSAPHLFYSRPKGTYVGADIDKLMVDFFLVNTTLSADGNRVRLTVDGSTEQIITEWMPYVVEGLGPGEHTIQLELLDAEGNPVPGPFNTVERTVTLEAAADEGA